MVIFDLLCGMTVLIVEDDPLLNQNIKEMLTSEGYTVELAYDGVMADKMLKKIKVDCVVLDINIPLKNGYEVCKSLRQTDSTTPVLFLTAFDELEDKIQGFESGGDDYLTKPFYMKELLLRIQSLVKRKTQNGPDTNEILVAEDLVVNQRTKSVKRNNVDISVTPREYQILVKLVMAKGELVSKSELIKEIWGSVFDANTNTIEVYINFLRNKVDKPFPKQLIKTKVGFGYYLDIST
jgi:two-component system, OmpR family, response regulator